MARIEPTIGRVVWYWPATLPAYDQGQFDKTTPYTAQICYVHKDGKINIAGFKHDGNPFICRGIELHQGEGDAPPNYAQWMPYQKGQAAKTEALEQQVAAGTVHP